MKFSLLCLSLLCTHLIAFDPLEEDFLSTLEEVSEIATKTKLNIDQTPSFVTVLHANKLKKLGIDTVYEALALVPGVQLSRESSGVPIVVFRGNTQKGEVKLMVDGVTINNAYRGSIYYYLDLPIDLIKRIEVIRGAGSVLHGSTAISGVVNIITHNSETKKDNSLFLSAPSFDGFNAGALLATDFDNWRLSLDAYHQKNDKTIQAGPDIASESAPSDQHLKDYSVGLKLSNGDFTLLSRLKKSQRGNAHGLFNMLDKEKDHYHNINESFFAQLSYTKDLSTNNKINISGGFNSYQQELHDEHPLGELHGAYKEYASFFQTDLLSHAIANNELLLGVKGEFHRAKKSDYSIGTTKPHILSADSARDTLSVYCNNTHHLTPSIDISAGLRYDNFSDYGDSLNPNLGAVYRYSDALIFKTLYSRAYRAPFWLELTSNADLKAEVSDTIEAGVILKHNLNNILRLNIYASKLDYMIKHDANRVYQNISKSKFLGSELEYTYTPNNQLQLSFLASYIDARDEHDNPLADVANIVSSASLTYSFDNGFTLGSLLQYLSASKRVQEDTREDFPSSLFFDQTLSYTFKTYHFYFTIKDLFDHKRSFAAPKGSYRDDFQAEGRAFLVKASVEF